MITPPRFESLAMFQRRTSIACGLALVIVGLSAPAAQSQEPVFEQFYGSGVHSFYERDYFQAMSQLSAAIDGGTRDPRPHYYRGLARMRTGDAAGAQRDMQRGAELESGDVNQIYPVARSLERIQGAERRTLERHRMLARAEARKRQMQRDAVRYEERRRAEADVLRAVPVGPPPGPLVPSRVVPATAVEPPGPAPDSPPAPRDDDVSPFDVPDEESPFDAADDSPFGAADDVPAEEMPADEPAPADDDPFGAMDDDPFGAADDDAEMPADDAPEAADDPFGEMPAGDAEAEDPFADDPN